MPVDRHDQPVSTASAAAAQAYRQGVDAVLAALPGPIEHLQRAVDLDPGFAMAWIALARARLLHADGAGARQAAARARERVPAATPRERSHVHALALTVEGRGAEALAAIGDHLDRHGPDALVMAPATGVFGLIGFSGAPDREEALLAFLQRWAPICAGDWWFDTALAFAECETGALDPAQDRVQRSLAVRPDNAHAAHVLAHVHHERGDAEAVLAFLARWLPGYDRSGLMHCHLSWHAALSSLQLGRTDDAWRTYRDAVQPGAAWGPPLNLVTDAASFLWRAGLAGQAVEPALWTPVHRVALESFPQAGVAFADVHVGLAAAAVGDAATLQRLAGELGRKLAEGQLPAGEVVPRLVQGWAAYARGAAAGARAALEPVQDQVVRIGGSRAQRELVALTLQAATRAQG